MPKTRITTTAQTNSGIAERGKAADGDQPVGGPTLVQRRSHPTQDPERHDEQEGEERELGRVPERRPDHLVDRSPEGVRLARVTLEDPATQSP